MIGIVADDITGANDIGIMFAKAGYVTHVYSYEPTGEDGAAALIRGSESIPSKQLSTSVNVLRQGARPDVVVLDTDSRFDTAEAASAKVRGATRQLLAAGCTRFINKTCSVGRGNIGAEFDAMLDLLDERFAVLVFGFPKNGRTTLEGIHYVHGKKLEESEFRNDPVHPMTRSDMVGIVQVQTKFRVANLTHDAVAQGADKLRERIEAMKAECNYLLLDVADQESLAVIAEAVRDEYITAGSSALSEELARVWGPHGRLAGPLRGGAAGGEAAGQPAAEPAAPASVAELGVAPKPGLGILCAAGSLMPQTAAQVAAFRDAGGATYRLDSFALFDEAAREREIARLTDELSARINAGEDALVHSPNEPDEVAATKARGAELGVGNKEVSRLVSGAVAEIVARTLAKTGQNRLVTAGGDTSAAVCARLGVKGMRIWKEIQPGLPSCVTLTETPLLLVLKSGSFGKPDFLVRAAEHVKQQ